MTGTYSLPASMINQLNRVDLISNNLANSNTNGFKQEGLSEGSFNNYLQKAQAQNFDPKNSSTVINTIPKIDIKYINGKQGPIKPTENEFDFALKHRDTFFKVLDENGEMKLTRDGAFNNINNFLVNGSGHKVLDANDEPIVAADGFEDFVGVVRADYTNLEKVGNNNYRIIDNEEVVHYEQNDEYIKQGAIERSNVNSVQTMVSLIDAHRRMAQAQKAITTIGELSTTAIEKLGRI